MPDTQTTHALPPLPAPRGVESLHHLFHPGCTHEPGHPCAQAISCLHGSLSCLEDDTAERARRDTLLAELRRDRVSRPTLFVGTGTCGLGAGAGATLTAIGAWLQAHGFQAAAPGGGRGAGDKEVDVVRVGCIGLCSEEPLVDVQLPGHPRVSYARVTADVVPDLLGALLTLGDPTSPLVADRLVGQHPGGDSPWPGVPALDQHPFFAPQTRRVLARVGRISPTSLQDYLAWGGYRALARALGSLTPEEVIDQVEKAGLRGRGGGGFPTAAKWKLARKSESDTRYLVCNADEGDPGAFMDRAVIEGDPHRVLEGMLIGAYAMGARHGFVYIRAEYPQAIEHLRVAIRDAREMGLLGHNILDSGFTFDVEIRMGAGAFVCGEETALMHSIEGRRGMPRPRPPFPTDAGLWGKPTVINNVETWANVPDILENGPAWYASVGTEGSKGTKVFALSGKVARTGLVEVAMGVPLRSVVFDAGGGIPNGKAYKAVQIGGPSGGCIPTRHLDIRIDYENLKTVGAMMGSGGLVVMDEDTCMVDVARYFMDFIQKESCGKCIPCREGTRRMLEVLTSITRGRGAEKGHDSLERFKGITALEGLARVIQDTSLCGLGNSAPNPVLSTLTWFRDEYEAHVFERRCPAGACKGLMVYAIGADKCRGCTLCLKKCPTGAILGRARSPHYIVPDKCVACGACAEVCRFEAVHVA